MDFLPGIAAGTTGCIIGHPFDAVKVRMQTNMYPTNYECVKQIITKPQEDWAAFRSDHFTLELKNSVKNMRGASKSGFADRTRARALDTRRHRHTERQTDSQTRTHTRESMKKK